jgi:hypothetical protein
MRIALRNGLSLFALLAGSLVAPFAQAVPVDPASLSGRVLHLRADDDVYTDVAGTSVATNGASVRHWGDQSISNSPALNSVAGPQQPTFATNVFPVNNLPAIRFDGTDDFLAEALDLNTGAKTVFAVYQLDTQSPGDIDSVFSFRDSVANTWTEVTLARSLGGYQDLSFTTDQNGPVTARGISGYAYNTNAHLFGFSYNGSGNTNNANFSGALDLTSPAVIASGLFNRNPDLGAIGARLTTAGGALTIPFDGSIGEIVVFNRQLSGSEFSGVQEFLYNKYFVVPPVAPEPSTAMLLGVALVAGAVRRRKKVASIGNQV